MRIYICDDDEKCRKDYARAIERILKKREIEAVVNIFDSAEKMLVKTADLSRVSIVFMDIHMPGMNGFEAMKAMRKDGFRGVIIVLSKSTQHWQQAFDFEAFNYLVKQDPIDEAHLEKILLKAVRKCEFIRDETMWVNSGYETRTIPLSEVIYFEVQKRIITVHFGNGEEFSFYSQLGRMEDKLNEKGFVRVHRSYLVSMSQIAGTERLWLLMRNGMRIPIGDSYKASLLKRLKEDCCVALN